MITARPTAPPPAPPPLLTIERGHAVACASCSTPTDPRANVAVSALGEVRCMECAFPAEARP